MSPGLLTLSNLLGGLSELSTVRKHLFRASREVLLAIQDLLGFADQYVGNLTSKADQQEVIRSAIVYAQKTLRGLAQRFPKGDDDEFRSLHRKVLGSILDVLEGEIRKNSKQKSQKSSMKVEVLQAIRNVLLKEMYDQEKEGS